MLISGRSPCPIPIFHCRYRDARRPGRGIHRWDRGSLEIHRKHWMIRWFAWGLTSNGSSRYRDELEILCSHLWNIPAMIIQMLDQKCPIVIMRIPCDQPIDMLGDSKCWKYSCKLPAQDDSSAKISWSTWAHDHEFQHWHIMAVSEITGLRVDG